VLLGTGPACMRWQRTVTVANSLLLSLERLLRSDRYRGRRGAGPLARSPAGTSDAELEKGTSRTLAALIGSLESDPRTSFLRAGHVHICASANYECVRM
jgi:hypothetical protein